MEKTREILTQAMDLIADPKRCCTGALACDSEREEISPLSDEAYSWCSMGAIQRVCPADQDKRNTAYDYLSMTMPDGQKVEIGTFHDTHTHAEVMALFRTAIATAQARVD